MNKYIKNISKLLFSLTLSFISLYFGYKSRGIELPGFLYAGLVSLAGLILTSIISHLKKVREDGEIKE